MLRYDPSGINGMLLVADLERARKESKRAELVRPTRSVRVVDSVDAARAVRLGGYVACDIECVDSETIQCVGFADSTTQAYVFVGAALSVAYEILADASIRKVFQNGQFDAYFLKTRCNTPVAGWTDDCMIAWHALWPEIAGKGQKGSKRTRKSLAFLASLYTDSPEWWKNYEGATDTEMYELNGRDCCITLEIMDNLHKEIAEQDVEAIYRHEMSMMPVLLAIQERGLCIDEEARSAAMQQLKARAADIGGSIRSLAEPLLLERRERISKPSLFFGTARCSCCNGGAKKRQACWSCAGLAAAPGKRANVDLGPCQKCGGVGGFETFEFNYASSQQKVELFYNVLGLSKRYVDGKVTCDEKALKAALAEATQ